jgi:hypothetical protein
MENLFLLALAGACAAAIYFWLQKRKQPKKAVIIPGPSQSLWDSTVAELLALGRDGMLDLWSKRIIANGGTYVPPTLGEGMSDQQIAEELAQLELGGRP